MKIVKWQVISASCGECNIELFDTLEEAQKYHKDVLENNYNEETDILFIETLVIELSEEEIVTIVLDINEQGRLIRKIDAMENQERINKRIQGG